MITTIEPPLTLLKEQKEAVPGDAVEPSGMALGLVPEILNPVDMVLPVNEPLRMVNPDVVKVRDVQRIIAPEGVRVHDAVWHDHALHDGQKRRASSVRNHDRVDPSSTLQQAENRNFTGSTSASFAFPDSVEIALIDFNLTIEWRVISISSAMTFLSRVKNVAAVFLLTPTS